MTTRQQLKRAVGVDRSDAGRGVTAEPAPTLPERLYAARERKGVDLYRAERDTKIRARYLGALERGDYKELPGAVYTKGFLRNYALYLGLDPDEVLVQWRRERGDGKEQPPAIVVPKPIAAPRQGLTFSPSLIVVALLTIVILAFGVYLGVQVLRFAKPPTIAVTQPATAVIDVEESTTRYTLEGATLPGATVSIATPGRDPYQVTATSDGVWAAQVDLRRGRNQFDVSALDPETGKKSEETLHLFITVPFLVIEAPTLTRRPARRGRLLPEWRDPRRRPDDQRVVGRGQRRLGRPIRTAGQPEHAARDTGEGDRAGRRRRGLQHALRADRRALDDHRHRFQPGGQDRRPDPPRDRRLQGRDPGRHGQGRPGLDQGLGRRQDRSEGRRRGQGHLQRQDPDLHRHAIDRGPDGLFGGDRLHPQRHVAGRPRTIGSARDMAVRATQAARKDPAAVAVADDPLTDLGGLAVRLGEGCAARGLHVATVESCTGGLVGHAITEVPGSSAWFVGGFVTYSNELKRQSVGVPDEVLAAHGAVSAQVAMAMATGGRERTGADLAVSVTGIAGPDGGSPAKPVGLTYVAVADAVGVAVRRFVWSGDRADNKRRSAGAALSLLLERIAAPDAPAPDGR